MRLLGNLIVRVIVILIGYVFAIIAAELFLAAGLMAGFVSQLVSGQEEEVFLGGAFVFMVWFPLGIFAAVAAFLPAMFLIAIAEMMRWRGMISNLLMGGVCSLFLGLSQFFDEPQHIPSESTLIILLATGFIGGFVYWLIAGRGAGSWMDKPKQAKITD